MANEKEMINISDEKIKELTEEMLKNVAAGDMSLGKCKYCTFRSNDYGALVQHSIKTHGKI